MKNLWNNVRRKHVIDAIRKFEKLKPNYPKPRSTFLVFKGKRYPAKHIRGLAFAIANKRKIGKSEYSGGLETANFFRKLGFEVEYLRSSRKAPRKQLPEKSASRKKLSLVEQKNALQKVLQKKFGIIETEKKFDWLKTPDPNWKGKEDDRRWRSRG
jgi:hypothetical protein